MSSVLIDTHCHVHVSLTDGTETAETGCCDPSNQTETETCITISSEGEREARDDLADNSDEDSSSDTRSPMNPPRPEVVHITMGIKEDDWLGAVRFGAAGADNLRYSHLSRSVNTAVTLVQTDYSASLQPVSVLLKKIRDCSKLGVTFPSSKPRLV